MASKFFGNLRKAGEALMGKDLAGQGACGVGTACA